MKAIVKSAAGKGIEVQDIPVPTPGPNDVVVDVAAASLCGTDRELYEWTPAAQAFGLTLPVVLGHEGAGTVTQVGADVTDLAPGDRVALESHLACGRCYPCRTGNAHTCDNTKILGMHFDGVFAETVAVPREICVRLPDSVSLETGALLESAGVGVHAIQRTGHAVAGRTVLVNGCGPIGLVIIQLSMLMGAAHVVAVEPNPFRRQLAEELGARAIPPTAELPQLCRELTGARGGFDVAFEVSGVNGVLSGLFESLRREATLVTIGHPGVQPTVDVAAYINKKGITWRGIFGRRLWDTWEDLLLLIDSGRLNLDWLVTHRLSLDSAEEAIGLLTGDANKVLLVPGLR
ncbi:zinc-dependent alcohol dehydrogenase [Stackebrandtia soli]|uniref:zinc-dependent alcohol dehydrogenase n=1 Tax=Stackebrandtia soli TaxID=1892856 RepID=UPI0039EBAE81